MFWMWAVAEACLVRPLRDWAQVSLGLTPQRRPSAWLLLMRMQILLSQPGLATTM